MVCERIEVRRDVVEGDEGDDRGGLKGEKNVKKTMEELEAVAGSRPI